MLEEALAGAIGAILAAMAFSAWHRRTVISNWWNRQRVAARQDEAASTPYARTTGSRPCR